MSKKWKIYCTEPGDEGWKITWSDTSPTTCPNNVAHSVDLNRVRILSTEKVLKTVYPEKINYHGTNWQRIGIFHLHNRATNFKLRKVKVIAHMDSQLTSFDLELYDVTNHNSLIQTNFTNATPDTLLDLGVISNPPVNTDLILEFNGKANGNPGKFFYIHEIIIIGE